MIPVITPFFYKQQGHELELSILSWQKFFLTPYQHIVIGDRHECLSRHPSVRFIPMARISDPSGSQYLKHLDIAAKLQAACRFLPSDSLFIWVADDCYPVRPFRIEDIPYAMIHRRRITGEENHPNAFIRDKFKTRHLLDSMGMPHADYTTHSPLIHNSSLFLRLVDRFDLTRQSFVIEDLYYNIYGPSCSAGPFSNYQGSLRVLQHILPDPILPRCTSTDKAAQLLPHIIDSNFWVYNSITTYSSAAEQFLFSRLSSLQTDS